MSLTLILNDNTEIDIVDANVSNHIVALFDDSTDYTSAWDLMTDENLEEIKIMEDDVLIHKIVHSHLSSTQAIINSDDTITGHFYFTGGDYADKEYFEAAHILLGEEEE